MDAVGDKRMIIVKIILAIIIVAAVVGVIAMLGDLVMPKGVHKPYGPYERFIKRGLDAFLATGAIIILSPVLLITAALVRVKLGSPVIFCQERPGKDEKIFRLYKFRSMTDKRDENGELLPNDQRMTEFGRALRSTSLDELPELWNILKGDMSIVGPRPLLVKYLPRYNAFQHRRHEVRPGLTGQAQVHGRNRTTWEERFQYDVTYVDSVTFLGDMKIVFLTVGKVFIRDGVSAEGEVSMPEFFGTAPVIKEGEEWDEVFAIK